MKRRLVLLLLILVVVSGSGLLAKAWLLNSDSGTRWVLNRVSNSLESKLSIGQIAGNFNDGLLLVDVKFEQQDLHVDVDRVQTQLGISLLPLQITFKSLSVQDVAVSLLSNEMASGTPSTSAEDILMGLELSIGVSMESMLINGLKVSDTDGVSLIQLDKVSLAGHWLDSIVLQKAHIDS